MKKFIVVCDYYGFDILGIFSSEEKAINYTKKMINNNSDYRELTMFDFTIAEMNFVSKKEKKTDYAYVVLSGYVYPEDLSIFSSIKDAEKFIDKMTTYTAQEITNAEDGSLLEKEDFRIVKANIFE